MITDAKIIAVGADPAEYHAANGERGTADFVVSASSIKLFNECPHRFVNGYQPPESEAKDYGNLLDTCLLMPSLFDKHYAVKPDTYVNEDGEKKKWNANANICKEWLREHKDLTPVSSAEVAEVTLAIGELRADPLLASILDNSDKQVHITACWKDESTGLVIPLKCLIDLVPKEESEWGSCVADLKTTRNASVAAFTKFAYSQGYHIQGAFNLDMLCAATGQDRTTFLFILQENFAPYQTGKRMLSVNFLEMGRRQYQAALSRYATCLKTKHWPDYDVPPADVIQGWSLMRPAVWMENEDWNMAMAMAQQAEEPEASEMPS